MAQVRDENADPPTGVRQPRTTKPGCGAGLSHNGRQRVHGNSVDKTVELTATHSALREHPRRDSMAFVPHYIREVLVQRPATVDVHQLHAPAYAERGQVAARCFIEQGDLPMVTYW